MEPAPSQRDEIERLVGWVQELQAAGMRLNAILATHHHPDHVGGARELKRRLNLPLWAHAATIERLGPGVVFDRALEDGQRIALPGPQATELVVMHTPGHAPGHLCYHDYRANVLLVGDMLATSSTVVIDPPDGNMLHYLESLKKIRELKARALLPAHGTPIENPETAVNELVAHRLARERKILAALKGHGRPARPVDLVPTAYDDTPQAAWPLAARSAEAHLLKLQGEGRAALTPRGWVCV